MNECAYNTAELWGEYADGVRAPIEPVPRPYKREHNEPTAIAMCVSIATVAACKARFTLNCVVVAQLLVGWYHFSTKPG